MSGKNAKLIRKYLVINKELDMKKMKKDYKNMSWRQKTYFRKFMLLVSGINAIPKYIARLKAQTNN